MQERKAALSVNLKALAIEDFKLRLEVVRKTFEVRIMWCRFWVSFARVSSHSAS